ncbi:hypothetical protein SISSUDRAFT_843319 [Sistotremastrum suecicum HHB10207 ss-3]|uniref:Micro-fibrillar-associated protein 1 C-terminal domain-containing protein n=1 Tax=Sistotremastrum suecicum HHB10207 ss-3 TaxID=1314776 RepID=A0A166HHU6_9AGAM|nr:hypothetical protein SISSUDRAFT_843319 [Sistotremastrum suecicum HHB10207 ss-3]
MSTTARKQAPRLARPAARYFKGKLPKGVDAADTKSDSEEEENLKEEEDENVDIPIGGESSSEEEDDGGVKQKVQQRRPPPVKKGINVALKDVNISSEGKVIVAGREESGRTFEEEVKSEAGEEEEEEEESSSEESESEEDVKPTLQFRPVFIPKRGRVTIQERDAEMEDSEEVIKKREKELAERKKQSHDMVADTIRRELAEKESEENVPDVDDTDGVDPTAEFEAWRLRELARIKRDKEEEVRREEEREEVERRRALPEAQRMEEDLAHAQQSRDSKPKGQQKFLQKYWHKGAFHQDEEILHKRDYTEATVSTVDVSLLPKVMQVRDFGKRSRTKYTHLVDQDTSRAAGGFGGVAPVKINGQAGESSGCFLCGGPHLKRDCPQNTGGPPGVGDKRGTGSNNIPTGTNNWRRDDGRGGNDSFRDRRDDRDRPRDGRRASPSRRDREYDRDSRSDARRESYKRYSRSPPPARDRRSPDSYRGSRRRSRDASRDRSVSPYEGDRKRQKVG